MTLYVAILLPFHDGSGKARILGVYDVVWKAEARCRRELVKLGYDQPTDVVECVLNND